MSLGKMDQAGPIIALARALAPALLALAATACGAGESPRPIEVERTDSAGVEVVTSSAEDHEFGLSLRRLFTLGGEEEGPESFYFLQTGLIDSDREGRIYVLDMSAARVVVLSPDGELIQTMGREGGGPGEFMDPNGIAVSPEGVVSVFNFGKGGLVRFAADGTVLPERSFQESPTWSRQRHFAALGGGIAVSTIAASPGSEERTHQLRLVMAAGAAGEAGALAGEGNPAAAAAITIVERTQASRGRVLSERCGGGIQREQIFSQDLIWDALGDWVAISAEPSYSIAVADVVRRATRIIRRPLAPVPATRELALAEVDEGFTMNFGRGPCTITARELVDGLGFADVVPPILNLRLAPDGELWVERRAAEDPTSSRIDIFDPTGAYLGTLPDGTPFPVLLLPNSRMAVVEKDEFDVARLVVMEVERQH